jgi:hypothetical protein
MVGACAATKIKKASINVCRIGISISEGHSEAPLKRFEQRPIGLFS